MKNDKSVCSLHISEILLVDVEASRSAHKRVTVIANSDGFDSNLIYYILFSRSDKLKIPKTFLVLLLYNNFRYSFILQNNRYMIQKYTLITYPSIQK